MHTPDADLSGKTLIVTGANSGIGLETTWGLAQAGATVIMACRDPDRADAARAALLQRPDAPDPARLVTAPLDLADKKSIKRFAKRCMKDHSCVDALVNNAGVWSRRRRETDEGLEQTFAINHLGTFRLTHALLPALEAAPAGRIVNVASTAHHFAKVDWDDLQMTRRFNGDTQYSNSKLYNLWFTHELARRLEGTTVTANALHPGTGATGLTRDFPPIIDRAVRLLTKNATTLAKTSIRLASDPDLEGKNGGYYHMGRHAHQSRLAKDPDLARRLWDLTEAMA